jgi:type III secretion protein V
LAGILRNGGRGAARFFGADAALAVLVVAVVALMVVPLPTWLLDLLLASNLAISVAILLVTLYVGSALEIASFPTLLLITTLVRIALNVSSTRLILLHADAGEVIRAFGSFVVSGNFVVGAVVFLILTVVQFVVVAKGSERVAEVGARFTLDALPGKQMAIDAEVRAGTLEPAEATAQRRALERESQFYGAMDGAVKFVKGDVIATVLIAVINIVGGVAIGMGQRGLSFDVALQRYGLLTIGDGLVTQIPALLLASAAGILVTRVASEDPSTGLGSELSRQLFGVPRALAVAGILVAGLGVVPGLPAAPFFVIGLSLIGASYYGRSRAQADANDDPDGLEFVPAIVPWSLDVGQRLVASGSGAGPATDGASVAPLVARLRERIFRERGVALPGCTVTVDTSLPDFGARLAIHEVPSPVVDAPHGLAPADAANFVEERLARVLLARAADFVGISETNTLLAKLEQTSPSTVKQLIPKRLDVATLTDVLRRLVEEGVGVRDLKGVLEALARAPVAEKDALNLAEHVRTEMRRAITFGLTGGVPSLEVVLLDSNIEETIRSAVSRSGGGSFLALAPAAARDVVAAVQRALGNVTDSAEVDAVILTRPDIRRFVRKLLETDLPRVRVLSFPELMPEVALKTRGRATLSGL